MSLHGIGSHSVLAPLVINLPSFPVHDINAVHTYLPAFLHRYPTATIHYRWPMRSPPLPPGPLATGAAQQRQPLPHWPIPIHDTLAGYDYLKHTLAPPPTHANGHSLLQRRTVYVYGRDLSAALAAALALSEAHDHAPMAVRGLLAVNGVYNWTTFLPDHPVNTTRSRLRLERGRYVADGPGAVDDDDDFGAMDITRMKALLPQLFQRPGDLFDPFASPLLFFHTAGLMVPPSLTERWVPPYHTDKLVPVPTSGGGKFDDYVYQNPEDPAPPTPFSEPTNNDEFRISSVSPSAKKSFIAPPTRKGYFPFPPRHSTLTIPTTLLMYSAPPPLPLPPMPVAQRLATWKKFRHATNSFGSQAMGLAGLMRRSMEKLARERRSWDHDADDPMSQALRRVETGEVAVGDDGSENEEEVQEMARQWFEDCLG